jgi:hypothetical protein
MVWKIISVFIYNVFGIYILHVGFLTDHIFRHCLPGRPIVLKRLTRRDQESVSSNFQYHTYTLVLHS